MSGFLACTTRPHPPKTLGFHDCQGTQPDGMSWFYIPPHLAWLGRDDLGSQPALGCFGSEQLGSGGRAMFDYMARSAGVRSWDS